MVQTLLKAPVQLLVHHDRTWTQFKHLQQGYSGSLVRLSFFQGTVEVLLPGRSHERFAEIIGTLLTFFFWTKGITYFPDGSTAQEQPELASIQPDKSYCFITEKSRPDLAIEITVTSGSINKLDLYKTLGIPEVWFWEDGSLAIYVLREGQYDRQDISNLLPTLDILLFKRCVLMGETDMNGAIDRLRTDSGEEVLK